MKKHRLSVLLLLLLLTPPAKLLWDVYRIPDYRGGEAIISTSPDGLYQGIDMVVPHSTPHEGWQPFFMNLSGYDPRIIMGLADGKTGQILAYVPINDNDLSTGTGGFWECEDMQKGPCSQYRSSFWYSAVELPPNRWHRLVAWTAAKLRGLGAPEFGHIENRESSSLILEQDAA